MSKKDSLTPQAKKENSSLKLQISLMVVIILFIAELYIIVNRPQNFVALAGITLLLLVWVHIFINAFLQETFRHGDETVEQYQNILKTEKASYLLLKKAFEQMESGSRSVTLPTEELISAQKALAKLTISRSRENTDALLNSHDKVMEMLYDFEEKLLQNNNEVISSQKTIADSSAQEQLLKQQEIIAKIRETEHILKNGITQVAETVGALKAAQSTQPVYIQEPRRQDQTFSSEQRLSENISGIAYETDMASSVPGESLVLDEEPLTGIASEPDGMAFNNELVIQDEMLDPSTLDFKDNGLLPDHIPDMNDTELPDEFEDLEDTALQDEFGDMKDTELPGELGNLEGAAALDELGVLSGDVLSDDLGLMDDTTEIGDFAFIDEDFPAEESFEGSEPNQQKETAIPEEQLFPEDISAMENSDAADGNNNLQEALFLDEEPQIGEMAFLDEEPMLEAGTVMDEGPAFQESIREVFTETAEPLMDDGSVKEFLSGQNQEPEASESEKLPESMQEQKTAEIPEEKPVAPDLSNPNKMLTPEEIAALIASM